LNTLQKENFDGSGLMIWDHQTKQLPAFAEPIL